MGRHIIKYQFEIFGKQFCLRIGEIETIMDNDIMPEYFDKANQILTLIINRVGRQEVKAKAIEFTSLPKT